MHEKLIGMLSLNINMFQNKKSFRFTDQDDVHFDLTPRSGVRSASKESDKAESSAGGKLLQPSEQEKEKSAETSHAKPGRSDRVRFGDK